MAAQFQETWQIAFVGSGHQRIDPKTAEVRVLEKKIRELETANDILKEALAFFAESQKKWLHNKRGD